MDWRHVAEWTQGIRTAELTRRADSGGFGRGADVTRTAHFLGWLCFHGIRQRLFTPLGGVRLVPCSMFMRSESTLGGQAVGRCPPTSRPGSRAQKILIAAPRRARCL
ncbi:hypothetical protein [Streptomyces sp. NPDC054783]